MYLWQDVHALQNSTRRGCMFFSSQAIGVYHSGALMYGITDVAESCLDWLLKHLMTSQTPTLLKQIRFVLQVLHT